MRMPCRHPRYVIKIREFAKFVVGLGEKVSATDIEESMRVGVDTSHGGKCPGGIYVPVIRA